MCTVTYLPLPDNNYILTSNRDETPFRKTLPPDRYSDNNPHLLYPKDTMAGGSWVCVSDHGRVVCLLNGAFTRHKRQLPYRKSRGLVVLESFEYRTMQEFDAQYNFDEIEPFTLVWIDEQGLFEFRWDGREKYLKAMDRHAPHIWASATLYTETYIEKRRHWFAAWLKDHSTYEAKDILNFHVTGGEGDIYNDILMNREGLVQTVSITSIQHQTDSITLAYHDLLDDTVQETLVNLY